MDFKINVFYTIINLVFGMESFEKNSNKEYIFDQQTILCFNSMRIYVL